MRVVPTSEVLAAVDEAEVLALVEEGFKRFSAGEVQVTAVGYLAFDAVSGDSHIKGAHLRGDDVFVVKISTSFYRNGERGLPTANGFSSVFSAVTGEVLAILHDQGRLTDLRAAAAGAIAARAVARPGSKVLGVVGAGVQAGLQARWISRLLELDTVLVWGRNPDAAAALAAEVGGQAASLDELCARADIIVTATLSGAPLLRDAMIRPGTRIIGFGADAPGKSELDPAIFGRGRVIVDSRAQCIDHGDTAQAIAAGVIDGSDLIELGELLAAPIAFCDDQIVVVDMTGLGVQDLQIAKAVWARLA